MSPLTHLTLLASLALAIPRFASAQQEPGCPTPLPAIVNEPITAVPEANPEVTESQASLQDPPTPAVDIRVRVPADGVFGQELAYQIRVENNSAAAAHHVLLRNPLPAHSRFVRAEPKPTAGPPELQWQLGTLAPGTHREITLILEPDGKGEVENCARVQFEHGQCVRTRIARPSLSVHKDGPTEALLNQSLHYKISITNTGPVELTNVQLADILPAGLEHAEKKDRLSWIVGLLAPGQSQSVEYDVVARKLGRLCNKVVATAAQGLREEMESCVVVREARLGLSMAGPKRRYLNTPAHYQLTVSNSGSAPLANVVVTDTIPEQTTLSSTTRDGQRTGQEIRWLLDKLEPGESRMFDVAVSADKEGRYCNRASVTAEGGAAENAEACTDFAGMSALSLEVQDQDDPIEVGGTTRYSITVRNNGSKPAGAVTISATVPDQLAITRVAGDADHHKDGQKIEFDPLTLKPGGEARYLVEVEARRAGVVLFKVELSADSLNAGGPVQQEESTTIHAHIPTGRIKKPPLTEK